MRVRVVRYPLPSTQITAQSDLTERLEVRPTRRVITGQLRKFTGWFNGRALHVMARSLRECLETPTERGYRLPAMRLVVLGPQRLVTTEIQRYELREDRVEVVDPKSDYAAVTKVVEVGATVWTCHSLYEIDVLDDPGGSGSSIPKQLPREVPVLPDDSF